MTLVLFACSAYVVEKRDLTHGGGWVPALSYVNAKYNHATVPRLLEGTKYEFRVMAENLQGRSDPLNTEKPVVAKNQFGVPGAPGRPEAVDSDKDFIKIKWTPPIANGGSPIIGYDVERRDKNTGRWIKLNSDPVKGQEYTDDRVHDGGQYEYRVSAVNAAGAGKPSEASLMCTARPMRERPKLHLDGLIGRRIKVRAGEPICVNIPLSGAPTPTCEWTRDGSKLPTEDRVWTETTSGETKLRIEKTTRDDTGRYTIRAKNDFGSDSADIEVTVVDRPGPPKGPMQFPNVNQEQITIEWLPPEDNGGSELTGYVVEMSEYAVENWRQVPGFCPKCTFTVKGLTEGKKYVFRVRAENMYGVSDPLEGNPIVAKSPFDPPDAPGQPEVLGYTPSSCSLKWTPPSVSGGKPVTGYYVEKRERGTGDWVRCNNYPTPNLTYTVPDLREGNRYEFRVVAVNEAGPGKPSKPTEPITAEHQRLVPDPPEPPKPDRITKDSVTLSWRPPRSDGGSKIKGYIVQKKLKGEPDWTDVNDVPVPETTFKVPNLKEGDDYQFRVIAVNDVGRSEPSRPSPNIIIEEQANKPVLDLSGVRDITVRAGEDFSIHVPYVGFPKPSASWFANDTILDSSDPRIHQQLADDYASLVVKGAKRGDTGQYRLQLRNPSGFDTATLNVRVLDRPSPPENLRADEFAGDKLTLYWSPPKDDGGAQVSNYTVERREIGTGNWNTVSNFVGTCFVRCKNLTIGKDYEFRVCAENKYGTSDPASTVDPIRARHPFDVPGAPGAPRRLDSSEDSITIAWTKPRHDGGSPITGYVIEKRMISEDKWTKASHAHIPDLNHKISGLIEHRDYEFRVAAVNAAGQGPWSSSSDPICCRSPPSAPKITSDLSIRDMTVIAGEEFTITVPFTANPRPKPVWLINSDEVFQDDRIKFDTNDVQTVFTNKCAKRTDSGSYTIQLYNTEGSDSATCRVLVVDKPTPPIGPLDVSDITPDTCTLTWKPPADDGGSPITNYVVEKMDPFSGSWVKVSSFVRGCHYNVIGLEPNKKYSFRVRAENQYGVSEPLGMDEPITAKFPFTVPDPPGMPRVTDWDAAGNVTITWDRPRNDGGARIQGYKVEFRDPADDSTWRIANDYLVKDNNYTVYTLLPGHEYEFRVKAKNAAGYSKPSQSSDRFKLKPKFGVPSPPDTPTVVKVGKNYADLKWEPPKSDGGSKITGYIIEKREFGSAMWVKCNDYNVADCEFTALNLVEQGDYEFRVYAVNAAGRSEPSACTTPVKICEVVGGEKPMFVRPLSNACGGLGKTLTLECEATGKPTPTARWLKNGRELVSGGGRFRMEDNNNGVFKLILHEVMDMDSGDYTCEASNPCGSVRTTCTVKVGTPPRIDRMPAELNLPEKENTKIKVFYSGDQPMDISLTLGGKPVPDDGRVKLTVFDEFLIIYIKEVEKSDAGMYTLTCKNDSGTATGNFTVNITGK
ncbi:hypothetical protein FOCC_FOCC015100, partial [Frankliniella occidentalis]